MFFGKALRSSFFCGVVFILLLLPAVSSATSASSSKNTVLATQGTHFTLNGEPAFLLGISYYAALGAPHEFIRADLRDFRRYGFNWIRVWATGSWFGKDFSVVTGEGEPRKAYLDKLIWLVGECDRAGIVVDVTLSRGQEPAGPPLLNRLRGWSAPAGRVHDFDAHSKTVAMIERQLRPYRNWYMDLANEHDMRDARYVSVPELKKLTAKAHEANADSLVTASWMARDLTRKDIHEALGKIGLDFLSPHRPRHAGSAAETKTQTMKYLAIMAVMNLRRPILYQEPFRRGYNSWNPSSEDFLVDLRGAIAGGAAGWCFHNGDERSSADGMPARSFDLSQKRLMDQLDATEKKFLRELASIYKGQPIQPVRSTPRLSQE